MKWVTVLLFLIFIFPSKIFAQDIVINEVLANPSQSPESSYEWIELFNRGSVSLNIGGFVLKDSDDDHQLILTPQEISPNGYALIQSGTSFAINNSGGEMIRLFTSSTSATPIDQFNFSSSQEDKSWGRVPDGSGNFQNGLNPTPGSANPNPSTPTPTPTATPTPTPTSTPSPTPTATPTPKPTIKPSPSPKPSPIPSEEAFVAGMATESGEEITPSPTPSPTASSSGLLSKLSGKGGIYLLLAGSIILVLGATPLAMKLLSTSPNEENEQEMVE